MRRQLFQQTRHFPTLGVFYLSKRREKARERDKLKGRQRNSLSEKIMNGDS